MVEKLPCTSETDTLLLVKIICARVPFLRSAFPLFLSPIIEDFFNKVYGFLILHCPHIVWWGPGGEDKHWLEINVFT
jgi:hypothetical protein